MTSLFPEPSTHGNVSLFLFSSSNPPEVDLLKRDDLQRLLELQKRVESTWSLFGYGKAHIEAKDALAKHLKGYSDISKLKSSVIEKAIVIAKRRKLDVKSSMESVVEAKKKFEKSFFKRKAAKEYAQVLSDHRIVLQGLSDKSAVAVLSAFKDLSQEQVNEYLDHLKPGDLKHLIKTMVEKLPRKQQHFSTGEETATKIYRYLLKPLQEQAKLHSKKIQGKGVNEILIFWENELSNSPSLPYLQTLHKALNERGGRELSKEITKGGLIEITNQDSFKRNLDTYDSFAGGTNRLNDIYQILGIID